MANRSEDCEAFANLCIGLMNSNNHSCRIDWRRKHSKSLILLDTQGVRLRNTCKRESVHKECFRNMILEAMPQVNLQLPQIEMPKAGTAGDLAKNEEEMVDVSLLGLPRSGVNSNLDTA